MRRHILNTCSKIWIAAAATTITFIILSFAGCHRGNGIKPEQVRAVTFDANRLEGVEWHLIEVSGSSVTPLRGERWPFVKFDGTKKQASGFNGCNNFFASYEIDASSLKFGPVAATRRFCEGTSAEVEMKFMQALDKTRSWEMKDGLLILLDNGDVPARFSSGQEDVSEIDLDSMTFLSGWFPSGRVTLSRGEHREPAAPDSVSEIVVKLTDKRAFGLIHGRETGAVVLVTDAAGSGTFYDLELLTKEADGWVNTDTVYLGDRVTIRTIEIKNNYIVVSMITHGPDDPMCCPTLEAVNGFTVKENRLVPVTDEPSTANRPEIIGTVWKWEQTLYNNDTKTSPANPNQYTLTLHSDGKVDILADCNRGGGTYVKEDSSISINITHTTMAMCPPESLEGEFLRNLDAAAIYFVNDGNLYFDLKFDTGTMKFSGL
jgi:heat shock protein HslJ